jgi:predicted  nucleic acid-binding Zn-ribbon protein
MDDLRQTLEKLRDELANAGKRLADLAEKGKGELPAAAKKIDEEYQRLQKLLDSAVEKLKQSAADKFRRK